MKITKQLLREIIEEEVKILLNEGPAETIASAKFEEVFQDSDNAHPVMMKAPLDGGGIQYTLIFLGMVGNGRTPEEALESFFQNGPLGKSRIIDRLKRGLLSKIKKN